MLTRARQQQIRRKIEKIYNDTYRDIEVFCDPTSYDCPNCFYDPTTGASTGVYDSSFTGSTVINGRTVTAQSFTRGRCPVCKGTGSIDFDNRKFMRAYIRWDPPADSKGEFDALPIGTEGSNVAMVKILDTQHYEFIRDSIYAHIDGVRCELCRPPTIRLIGTEKAFVLAFFASSEPGASTTTR